MTLHLILTADEWSKAGTEHPVLRLQSSQTHVRLGGRELQHEKLGGPDRVRGYPPAGGHESLGRVYHQVRLGFIVIGKLIVCYFLNLTSGLYFKRF